MNPTPAHSCRNVSVVLGGSTVLDDVTLEVAEGEHLVVVGPNGCGKSTLLSVLAGLLRPTEGSVDTAGRALASMSRRRLARLRAVLPQESRAADGLTVRELVAQARYAHRGALGMLADRDHDICSEALRLVAMTGFADRAMGALSGGERQRARLAMALAQQAPSLFLDEPTSFLDVRHQLEVLHLLERLRGARLRTVVTVLHDLGQALNSGDRIAVMHGGRLLAVDTPDRVVESGCLGEAFGIDIDAHRGRNGWNVTFALLDNDSHSVVDSSVHHREPTKERR